jgi:hypothetical protein
MRADAESPSDNFVLTAAEEHDPAFEALHALTLPRGCTGLRIGGIGYRPFAGWVGGAMTRAKTFAATAVVWSIILVAAGATFRDARPGVAKSPEDNTGEPLMKKSDRLPLSGPTPLATVLQPEVTRLLIPQPQQLKLATEDDIRQAEAEHHRHRAICPHGRTFFTVEHHQRWRCKL